MTALGNEMGTLPGESGNYIKHSKHGLHVYLRRFNTLTLHSLSTRDNLRDFIVTEWLHVERAKEDPKGQEELDTAPVPPEEVKSEA
ncbi:hypothetical protein NQZ68_001580 [Dissostichus eleginoides]|nr:hypothetical protein NQZ68_001580 [Dissostichus eleginoides]